MFLIYKIIYLNMQEVGYVIIAKIIQNYLGLYVNNNNIMKNTSKGISPVIGVVLFVAVTVGLITATTFFIYDIGNNNQYDDSTATIMTEDENNVKLIRNDGFEKIQIQYENGDIVDELSTIGESIRLNVEGEYNIIGISSDGTKHVINSIDIDSGVTEIFFESEDISITEFSISESSITNINTSNTTSETTNEKISFNTDIEITGFDTEDTE